MNTKRAFTLVETVIVVSLLALMMVAIGLVIFMLNKTSSYNSAESQSSGSASAVLRDMESLIVQADAVVQTHTFSGTSYVSSATTTIVEIPSIDTSGAIIANSYDYAVFYLATTSVYRILAPAALSSRSSEMEVLSTTVSTFSLTYNDPDFTKVFKVTVDLQTSSRVKQYTLTDHRREQLILRNF